MNDSRFRAKPTLKGGFWARFFMETLGSRRIDRLIRSRLRGEIIAQVDGLTNLPAGDCVLAVNHFSGRATLDTIGVVLKAVQTQRPDVTECITLIVGKRERTKPPHIVARVISGPIRRFYEWIFQRWQAHAIRLPLRNPAASLTGLRSWRQRGGIAFVFPEGRANLIFQPVRDGAGRWLAAFPAPTLPVAAWWEQNRGWSVHIGTPIQWADDRALHDLQLSLAIAALLPAELCPQWQAVLRRWQAVHARYNLPVVD